MELHFNVWLPYVHKDVSGLPDEVMEREKQELCVRVVDRGLSFFFLQTDVEIQCMTELSDKKKKSKKKSFGAQFLFKQKWQFKVNILKLYRRPPANSIQSRTRA